LFLSFSLVFIFQFFLQGRGAGENPQPVPAGGDLAVIGGTTAALLTAWEAAANGAQVFLFPNGQALGEDSIRLVGDGLAAAFTPPQIERAMEFTPELLIAYLREYGGGINDPLLLVSFRAAAPVLYQKAEQLGGVSFSLLPQPEQKPYLHYSPDPEAGLLFKEKLCQAVTGAGVVVREEKVKGITLTPAGKVEALIIENQAGKIAPFYVQAAVLADGGYSGDVHHWHRHLPRGNLQNLWPDQQGLGLRLAKDLGLDLVQMDFMETRLLLSSPPEGQNIFLPPDPWPEAIYFNEKDQALSGAAASLPEIVNLVLYSPATGAYILAPGERAAAYGDSFREHATYQEWEQSFLPAGNFFIGRRLPGPPYHTAVLKAGVVYTLGGLSITPRGEVKQGGEAVPGLYAAGEIVGGLHGEALLPGMALSETIFTAELAGSCAAEYAGR
jgi:fumarate reductase flavoprotein subunit